MMTKKIMPLINTIFNVVLVGVFSFSAANATTPYLMVGQLVAAGCWAVLAVMNSGVLDNIKE